MIHVPFGLLNPIKSYRFKVSKSRAGSRLFRAAECPLLTPGSLSSPKRGETPSGFPVSGGREKEDQGGVRAARVFGIFAQYDFMRLNIGLHPKYRLS